MYFKLSEEVAAALKSAPKSAPKKPKDGLYFKQIFIKFYHCKVTQK